MPSLSSPYDTWFADAEFDAGYGHTLSTLLAITPIAAPEGFETRWQSWRKQAKTVDAAPTVLSTDTVHGRRVSVVEHSGADGIRLRAWLVEPLAGPARVGVVHSHGYGGRDGVDLARIPGDAAAIFPVARGLPTLNAGIGAPEQPAEHVLAGIDDPERYMLGLCARDLWLAADALTALVGTLPLYYIGESFGGGIGALALPWDERYIGATLIVPSFGQYDERLAVHCLGSGEAVRDHVAAHPEAREVLRWFDASTALGFARLPVRVEAALWDPYVPPAGQFGVANAARMLDLAVLPAGHAEYPGSEKVTAEAISDGRAHLARTLRAAS
ncbi:acetylxylan esterase [Microbacterium sp. NPDC087589]|uniref:acetylxylan esterase n=1 Tax=Microbacterium sp. NPDC087589 TaxID=3364191 RepID=UPI00381607B4